MQLKNLQHGRLRLIDSGQEESFGSRAAGESLEATIRVLDARFYSEAVFGGTVGAGEAYMRG